MEDARRAFLSDLIDDAGLFPPVSLSTERAVRAHRMSRTGPNQWILGRFICPAGRLGELWDEWEAAPAGAEPPWRLSVLLQRTEGERWPASLDPELKEAAAFAERAGGRAAIELVETRLPDLLVDGSSPDSLIGIMVVAMDQLSRAIPARPWPFIELPFLPGWRQAMPRALRALASVRELTAADPAVPSGPPGAKIRCGGQTAAALPTPEQVAAFVATCRDLAIPFKATAGLHHPVRHVDPATDLTQHGFLNVAGAAVLAHARGLDEPTLAELVGDDHPEDFALTADGFRWRGLSADAEEIARAREQLFVAYGSCSFEEPVEDLTTLDVLPLDGG